MKNIILLIVCFVSFQLLAAQEAPGYHSITAKVPNIYQEGGKVIFSLYTEENFMKKPVVSIVSEIEDKMATVTFTEVPSGTYAIIVLHDKNENNQMDYNASGMPAEAYGISNNPMSFGPPNFLDAKFKLSDADLELEIRL